MGSMTWEFFGVKACESYTNGPGAMMIWLRCPSLSFPTPFYNDPFQMGLRLDLFEIRKECSHEFQIVPGLKERPAVDHSWSRNVKERPTDFCRDKLLVTLAEPRGKQFRRRMAIHIDTPWFISTAWEVRLQNGKWSKFSSGKKNIKMRHKDHSVIVDYPIASPPSLSSFFSCLQAFKIHLDNHQDISRRLSRCTTRYKVYQSQQLFFRSRFRPQAAVATTSTRRATCSGPGAWGLPTRPGCETWRGGSSGLVRWWICDKYPLVI